MPILKAEPEVGESIDDPSEDAIFMLLDDIEEGQGNYLIITRTADATGHTYAQTYRNDDGSYLVEYRAGGADRHFQTIAADMRTAHNLLTAWAFELDGWRERAEWSRLEL
ncbi:hypothetical protein [Kutzneria buriramensis]|uniref:Uncharacterized protein n=1 Tax=Kutzneria buriramensis TaxID=1045776 RepID=A0A3E0I6N2_9PSEU|nr:hypothetical protein [Kutzneria buriramensis]REH54271.1 hypothetical protein BCF44_102503 [Kutzneria buriramensis]